MNQSHSVLTAILALAFVANFACADPGDTTLPAVTTAASINLLAADEEMAVDDDEASNMFLNLNVANFLFSPDLDGFTNDTGGTIEEIEGYGSWVPTVMLGWTVSESESMDIDVSGGGGALVNGAFVSPLLMVDVAARFKISDTFHVGPHIGYAYFFKPEWIGDTDVDFQDGASGLIGGVMMTIGNPRISGYIAADYAAVDAFGVTAAGPSSNEIDITGFMLQLGARLRF